MQVFAARVITSSIKRASWSKLNFETARLQSTASLTSCMCVKSPGEQQNRLLRLFVLHSTPYCLQIK